MTYVKKITMSSHTTMMMELKVEMDIFRCPFYDIPMGRNRTIGRVSLNIVWLMISSPQIKSKIIFHSRRLSYLVDQQMSHLCIVLILFSLG